MTPDRFNPIRRENPKRKDRLIARKGRMVALAQEWKPITSPLLREVYSAKIEWARKLLPKLKKEAEAPEEKEDL